MDALCIKISLSDLNHFSNYFKKFCLGYTLRVMISKNLLVFKTGNKFKKHCNELKNK